MVRRTRAQQVRDEKGDHPTAMTSGQLCRFLNITPDTLRRRLESGSIPAPAARTPNGWRLWTPDQVTELVRRLHA